MAFKRLNENFPVLSSPVISRDNRSSHSHDNSPVGMNDNDQLAWFNFLFVLFFALRVVVHFIWHGVEKKKQQKQIKKITEQLNDQLFLSNISCGKFLSPYGSDMCVGFKVYNTNSIVQANQNPLDFPTLRKVYIYIYSRRNHIERTYLALSKSRPVRIKDISGEMNYFLDFAAISFRRAREIQFHPIECETFKVMILLL